MGNEAGRSQAWPFLLMAGREMLMVCRVVVIINSWQAGIAQTRTGPELQIAPTR